jgi:signal transduction histidine kinase
MGHLVRSALPRRLRRRLFTLVLSTLPPTLAARIFLLLVCALLLSHSFSSGFFLYLYDRSSDTETAYRLGSPMASAFARAVAARAGGAQPANEALVGGDLLSHWRSNSTAPPDLWREQRLEMLIPIEPALTYPARIVVATPYVSFMPGTLEAAPTPNLVLALCELARQSAQQLHPVRISLELPDGSWLDFTSQRYWRDRPTGTGLALAALASLAFAVGVFQLAVKKLAAPFSRLAHIAQDSQNQLDSPPLPETGPAECRSLARALNTAREKQRELLQERTRFLAAISHDLRTPATRLKLRAEFITDESVREKILTDLDEMMAMIGATLDFLREDALREALQAVSFSSLLQSLCDDYADLGHAVTFEEAPPLAFAPVRPVFGGAGPAPSLRAFELRRDIRLVCRPASLRRAFSNLIDNALKYGQRAHIRLDADAQEIRAQVLDMGPGIPPEQMDNVFKPFFRLERSRNRATGGTGLGLAIVKTIISAHGGNVGLDNRQQGGLEVTVTLPRRAEYG